jgi:serine protease inhibitor
MKSLFPFIFSLLFLASACSQEGGIDDAPVEANLRSLAYYETELAQSSSKFAIDLFHQLNKAEEPNQFYSPYSIHQALSMTMNGNEGEVLEEFQNLLRYEGMSLEESNKGAKELTEFLLNVDPKVKLAIANAIWYKQQLEVQVPFRNTAQNYYNAEVAPLDMHHPGSVHIINKWIEKQTNNLIKDMLDQIPAEAVMYLVNAIYFKGDWKYQFVPSKTQKKPFHTESGNVVQVDMMDLDKGATFKTYAEQDFRYLEIPYSTGQYSMGVLINHDGDLNKVTDQLTFENLDKWRKNSHEANFVLKMPKFKLRQKLDNMSDDLQELGLVSPFRGHPENFTRLFENYNQELIISRVIHDALIEVDEKGSEAAAATIVEISYTSLPAGPTELVLDKPFIFFIQEAHSGAILFMGKLGDPSLL